MLPVQAEHDQLAKKLQEAEAHNKALQAAREAVEEQLAALKALSADKTTSPAHVHPPAAATAEPKPSTQVGLWLSLTADVC